MLTVNSYKRHWQILKKWDQAGGGTKTVQKTNKTKGKRGHAASEKVAGETERDEVDRPSKSAKVEGNAGKIKPESGKDAADING